MKENFIGMVDPALALIHMEQTIKEFNEKNDPAKTGGGQTAQPAAPVPNEPKTDIPVVNTYDPFPRLSMDPFAYADLRYLPDSVDDFASMRLKLYDFDNDNSLLMQSLENRFNDDYYKTYHGDAADYAAELNEFYKRQKNTANYLLNDIEAYRAVMGDDWANEQKAAINDALYELYNKVQGANADADYWSMFEDAADYGAAVFNNSLENRYGESSFSELYQDAKSIEDSPYNTDPAVIDLKTQQYNWLQSQMASIATVDDIEWLKKETEEEYGAVSELYNDGDTSDENVRIFNEMQALLHKINDLDATITYLKDQAYYEEMASIIEDLPEQLMEDTLNIPYLEDEKMKIIEHGLNDRDTALKVDEVNLAIGDIKQRLKELGYTNKEINGFIIYAELLHDRKAYDALMVEKTSLCRGTPRRGVCRFNC